MALISGIMFQNKSKSECDSWNHKMLCNLELSQHADFKIQWGKFICALSLHNRWDQFTWILFICFAKSAAVIFLYDYEYDSMEIFFHTLYGAECLLCIYHSFCWSRSALTMQTHSMKGHLFLCLECTGKHSEICEGFINLRSRSDH